MDMLNIRVCNPPEVMDRYEFQFSHLDCDCIIDKSEESHTKKVKIIAYATSKEGNLALRKYFHEQGYSNTYKILRGIGSKEVNSID